MTDVTIPPASAGTTGFLSESHNHGHHDQRHEWLKLSNFYTSQADQHVAIGKTELATEKTGAAGLLATNVASSNLANLITGQFYNSSSQAVQFNAATNLAIEKIGAAQSLDAQKNAAAVLAAIAECCCEQKMLTIEEASKTRELIQSNQSMNLAVQLTDAKNEVLALRLKTPTLVV
jgi:hypothetical protein